MQRRTLTQAVTIGGRDFWGRAAEVTLEPVRKLGWHWYVNGHDVPLQPDIVHHAPRRLVLRHENAALHVFEHLGPLRFTGLDGVRIIGSGWLPYDRHAIGYWDAVKPHLRSDGYLLPMHMQRRHFFARFMTPDGKKERLSALFGVGSTLSIAMRIDHKKWGKGAIVHSIPGPSLEAIFASRPLGKPPWLRNVAHVAKWLGWPHYNAVFWPHGQSLKTIRAMLLLHRLQDMLGALSVIAPPGEYLTGSINNLYCGGDHALDVELLRLITPQLPPPPNAKNGLGRRGF